MNALELMEAYPKTALVIKQWYLDRMLESLDDESLPEDFKKMVRESGIDDDKIAVFIDVSPRGLFDIFDNHKIFINIIWKTSKFSMEINGLSDKIEYETRLEAEKAAVQEAFKLLNDKL